MDLDQFNSSKYLAKTDVSQSGLNLTIAGFDIAAMNDGAKKPIVSWLEPGIKPMVLNKINRERLKALCGTSDTTKLPGKRVNVYRDDMVEMGGQLVGGLRLRAEVVQNSHVATEMTPELAAALALVRQRAQDAQRGGSANPVDPNDEIPF